MADHSKGCRATAAGSRRARATVDGSVSRARGSVIAEGCAIAGFRFRARVTRSFVCQRVTDRSAIAARDVPAGHGRTAPHPRATERAAPWRLSPSSMLYPCRAARSSTGASVDWERAVKSIGRSVLGESESSVVKAGMIGKSPKESSCLRRGHVESHREDRTRLDLTGPTHAPAGSTQCRSVRGRA